MWLCGGWYVTHTGLLGLASRRNCAGIEVHPAVELCDKKAGRWVFAATVFPTRNSKGFSGYGEADPANVGERAVKELIGIVNVSHRIMDGRSLVNFEGFAPASQSEELAPFLPPGATAA